MKLEKILFGLGFTDEMLKLKPNQLSGGFQVRLNLAKTLVSNPNMLLLDEPNNYLDIISIRWLSRFLNAWQGELILITHDRSFMDGVVSHVIGLHRKKIRKIKGKTEKYYSQLSYEEETYEKARVNDEKKIKEMERFINKFRAKARQGSLVQSRVKTLNKLEKKNKLYQIQKLDFDFLYKPTPAKILFSAKNISFGYTNENILIKDFTISIAPHDRVCIIGKNGKGKTTLLKLLAKKLKAQKGELASHHLTEIGYYEQTNVNSLNPNNTVLQEIAEGHPMIEAQRIRKIAGMMMFSADNALKKISVLSGGEKARILLGKILVKPVNVLMLDDPTNHLDMESASALLNAIHDFKGAVIMVTHNEDFLNKLANKLIVFKKNELLHLDYGYKDFLKKVSWDDIPEIKEKTEEKIKLSNKDKLKLKEKRKEELKPIKELIRKKERNIEESENNTTKINQDLINASAEKDSVKIANLSKILYKEKQKLDKLYLDLEELLAKQEKIENKYKDLLN